MSIRPATTALGPLVALLIALCGLSIYAQSGRRKTAPPPVAPVPTPTPEPTPPPARKKDENAMTLLVAGDDRGLLRYPLSFIDAATTGCADRLGKRSSLNVDLTQRKLSRGEAIAKAKSDKSTYVVLLGLVEDMMNADSTGYVELEVDYVVFAPGTAKVLATGRVYENGRRKGPLVVPRGPRSTMPIYREQSLRAAGEDAAERILKALHLDTLPPIR